MGTTPHARLKKVARPRRIQHVLRGRAYSRIYLDYAAATPLDPQVLKAMTEVAAKAESFGNPSSVHTEGRTARDILERARRNIARTLRVRAEELVFTSGGTESDNLAIVGIGTDIVKHVRQNTKQKLKLQHKPECITTPIEHSAILEPLRVLSEGGMNVITLPVTAEGILPPERLAKEINPHTALVSISLVNSEIGVIQRAREIGTLLRAEQRRRTFQPSALPGPYLHLDASQAAGYLSLSPEDYAADLLTLDAAKIYGPKGVGLLFVRRGVELAPHLRGGGQEEGRRAGTENIVGAVGLSVALARAEAMRAKEVARLSVLQKFFIQELTRRIPGLTLNGSLKRRSPANINVCVPGMDAEFMLIRLDEAGISCSAASACRTLSADGSSYVIEALPGRPGCGAQSLRFTLGRSTTRAQLFRTADVLCHLLNR